MDETRSDGRTIFQMADLPFLGDGDGNGDGDGDGDGAFLDDGDGDEWFEGVRSRPTGVLVLPIRKKEGNKKCQYPFHTLPFSHRAVLMGLFRSPLLHIVK